MELKAFVGQVVVNTATQGRFRIVQITSPEIKVVTLEPDQSGHYTFYTYPTINADPFAAGRLVFEDPALAQPFREAYDAYCRTTNAFWEEYGYWMRRD